MDFVALVCINGIIVSSGGGSGDGSSVGNKSRRVLLVIQSSMGL